MSTHTHTHTHTHKHACTEKSTYTLTHIRSDVLMPCEGRCSAPTCSEDWVIRCEKPPRLRRLILCPARPTSTPFSSTPHHQTPPLPPSLPLSRTLLSKSISRSLHYRSLGHRLLHLWGENVCILCLCVVSAVGERGRRVCWGDRGTCFMGRCQGPFAFLSASHLRLAAETPASPSHSRLSPHLPALLQKTQKVKNTLEGCL